MGKFKQKKNKTNRTHPTGLPSEKECEERELAAAVAPVSGSINHLIQKVGKKTPIFNSISLDMHFII